MAHGDCPLFSWEKLRSAEPAGRGALQKPSKGAFAFSVFTASPLTFRALLVSNQSRLTYLSSRHIFCVLAVSVLQQSEVHSLLIAMISASRANGCRISALGTVSVLQAWLAHVVHTHLHSQASTVPKFFDPDTVNLQQSFPWPKTQRSTMLILCLYLTPN